jgi:uncharacterized protein with HEPN domain
MTDQAKKYLSDIIKAIGLIENFIFETESFDSYSKDAKTQSAVERQLGIIGEAVNQFNKLVSEDVRLTNGKKIIGFRNRLIHAYDAVDNAIVWTIVNRHLKELKRESSQLLV